MRTATLHDQAMHVANKRMQPDYYAPLELWLKADALGYSNNQAIGDTGFEFTDFSGNSHHGAQTTSSFRPVFKTNQFNGLPAIDFDGTDDYLTLANSGVSFIEKTESYTFTAVFAKDLDTVSQTLLAGSGGPSFSIMGTPQLDRMRFFTTAFPAHDEQSNEHTPRGPTDLRMLTWVVDGATGASEGFHFYEGSRRFFFHAAVHSVNTHTFTRLSTFNTSHLNARVCEMCAWKVALTPGQISDLARFYFKPKWGLQAVYDTNQVFL